MKRATLILMRHGQSIWNEKNLFTGWVDIPLSQKGIDEAVAGGKKIAHLPIDVAFTSSLIRAQMTLTLALLHHGSGKVPIFQHGGKLGEWGKVYGEGALEKSLPVHIASELNERMYGELQGLNKKETAQKFGEEQVHKWRRSYRLPPPQGESLEMTAKRAIPYFEKRIVPHLERGESVFVAAHGNSLRAIVMEIEKLSEEEVLKLEIPTGEPLLYVFEKGAWSRG